MSARWILPEHDPASPLSEEWLFKVGAILFLLGGVLGGFGEVPHPRVDVTDPQLFTEAVAGSAIWIPIHLAGLLSVLLTLGGMMALYRSLSTQPERGLARLGLLSGVVGAATTAVWLALDGVALKRIADTWAASDGSGKEVAFTVARAIQEMVLPLQAVNTLIWFGLPFLAFGLAVIYSSGYPSWMGWIAVVGGLACILLSVVALLSGPNPLISGTLIPAFTMLNSVWLIPVSILLQRRARQLAAATALEQRGGPARA